ncbi:diguanylate cyclase [Roseomonas sp. BN140053]|uniref:sensor domain-containing diguanylate cyclase n=1 Tax=Roseomonas sp. BN140053 TaxID=3391898 RepID=UPI0039ED5116
MDAAPPPGSLEEEHEALLGFLYMCPAGLLQLDASGAVQMLNPPAAQMLLPLLATPVLENLFTCLEGYAPELRNLVADFHEPRGTICENHRIHVSQVADRPAVLSCTLLRIRPDCIMAVLSDVSAQVAQERRLQQAESWFGTLLAGVHDFALFSLDRDGRIDSWNASAQRHTGFTEAEVLGRTLHQFYAAEDVIRNKAQEQIERARREGWAVEEGRRINRDGRGSWMQSLVAALREQDGEIHGFSVVMRDTAERKVSTDELRRLLTTDHLTGAANRARLFDVGEIEIARWKRHGSPLSAIMFDADHFKRINDSCGHAAGDAVLRELARRCRDGLRAVDTLARYGGEEFVVLLPGMGEAEAAEVAEHLRCTVAERPVEHAGTAVPVTLSLGCASMGPGIAGMDDLLNAADAAMYRAKQDGRNRVVLHRLQPEPVRT